MTISERMSKKYPNMGIEEIDKEFQTLKAKLNDTNVIIMYIECLIEKGEEIDINGLKEFMKGQHSHFTKVSNELKEEIETFWK